MNKNNIESIYALTPMQEGLLYHSLRDPKQYLDQYSCRLSGNVNTGNLIRAWEIMIETNAALRTAFVYENVKEFLQVVIRNCKADFGQYDWRDVPEADRQGKLQSFLDQEMEIGFELDKPPLTKLALIRITESDYYFVWTIHHLIVDGVSLPQVLGQVYDNYRKLCNNAKITPNNALPFKAYVDWIKRQDRNRAVNFWTESLKGFSEPTPIATLSDTPDDAKGEDLGYHVTIDEALVKKLQEKAKQYGLALYQFYNLAYAVMISRFSNRKDVVYGTIVSGRPLDLPGIDETIGIFINTIPVRAQIDSDTNILAYMKKVAMMQVERNKYEYLPLTDIISLSEAGSGELFDSLFVFQNIAIAESYMDSSIGYDISEEHFGVTTNYYLTWSIVPGKSTKLNILYKSKFMDMDSIVALSKEYIRILEAFSQDIEIPIGRLKTDRDEKEVIPVKENSRKPFKRLRDSFAANKRNMALKLADEEYTYEALELKADGVITQIRLMKTKTENNKAAVISRNLAGSIVAIMAAIKDGLQPVLMGCGFTGLDSICEQVGIILTDANSFRRIPQKYYGKCILLEKCENKDGIKYDWVDKEDYSLVYSSVIGEETVSGAEIGDSFAEVENQAIMVDLNTFDHNFIIRMMLRAFMNGTALKVFGCLSENADNECVFTRLKSIENAGTGFTGKNAKIYLPFSDVNGQTKPTLQNLMPDMEIRTFLADVYTGKEIYSIRLNDRKVLKNDIEVYDIFGNKLPNEFTGALCFTASGNSRRRNSIGKIDSGYIGKIKTDGTLEIFLQRSQAGYIGGKPVDYKAAESFLKETGLVTDINLANKISEADGFKTAAYYVCPSDNKESVSSVEKEIIGCLSGYWEISDEKLSRYVDFCGANNLHRDSEGNIGVNKLAEEETAATRVMVEPESETEKRLAQIWKEILKISDFSVEDDFFDLGGNSISIMKVISRTVSAFNAAVTINDLFDNPTVRKFAALMEERLSGANATAAAEKPLITLEEKRSGIPASFAQQRFWFLHQFDNDDVFYNISEIIKLTGHVNLEALQKTIRYICEKQEALRTVYYMKDGMVYQKVIDSRDFPDALSITELSSIKDGNVSDFIEDEIRRPFDFQNGPLFRCNLVRISETESMFVLVIHHVISDGWSVGIFINELMEAYQSYCSGQTPSLGEVQWQYGEYSLWQREKLKSGVMDKQLDYWKEKLDDANELDFPLDFERPAIQSFTGHKISFKYPKQLLDKVKAAAKKTGSTTFMIYLAALNVMFSRYSGQEDILIGSPVTSRPMKEVENTIGCFLNTLVFRNSLDGNPTFAELVQRVRQTSVEAFDNQDIPFDVLVDKLGVKRDLSKNPLFQIMFLFQNEPHPDEEMVGLKIERLEPENKAAMLDISISMQETDNGINAIFEYNTDLFRDETIERLSEHLCRIADVLCSDTATRINDFNFMSDEEIHHVIYELNDTKVKFDTDLYIHQLFEEQAAKHPNREALRFREQSLTYNELNIRINKLANYLLSIGIKKRQMVAVYMERSVEMVVALYGILKAGAAYVPVDPSYPSDRIEYMLKDSNVEIVLTQDDKTADLEAYHLKTIVLGDHDVTTDASDKNPEVKIQDDDYAYMIYTSGSTGRPKGVINTHKGIRNRILWIRTYFPPDESGRQMQKTPFSFDVSCGEFFGSLTVGACLVVAEPDGHKDVDYLIDLINKEKITHVHFVPSMLKPFLYSPRISEVKGLRQICCTGEPLAYSLVERFKELFSDCDLFNLYGPTEAAVEVSCFNCRTKLDRKIISIGKPIANTQLYILDKNLRPVPVGVCGELYIAGDNLAAGYHNRPDLTAERFIPNPYSMGDNPLMYKTGDYARLLPGGELDFIGRIDNQVKIRGNRIELGEIETDISSYPGIGEVHVIVSKEETPRIIAYVVLEDKTRTHMETNEYISELRQFLKTKLPDYMIPSFIMVLDVMPLMPNGKFNVKALPLPAISRDNLANEYTEAQDDTEIKLKQIWSEVLKVNQIGIDDNFFEMGGHSLLLIEVYNKVKEAFDTNLTIVDMFKYPTIRSLSKCITGSNSPDEKAAQIKETEDIKEGNRVRQRNNARMRELRNSAK